MSEPAYLPEDRGEITYEEFGRRLFEQVLHAQRIEESIATVLGDRIELGPFGIIVNSVAPGFIATAMTEQTAARMGVPFEEFTAAVAAQTPIRRVGQPEDVAGVIAFLCSADASYVSGQVVYVRGGL